MRLLKNFPQIKTHLLRFLPRFVILRFGLFEIKESLEFDRNRDIRDDIRKKYGFEGELLEIFASHNGHTVHKWHHYIPIYDTYFSRFRNNPVKFLEIGVSKGGSLEIWRKYFGPEAIIFGIDIDKSCSKFNGLAGEVRIGSQIDEVFLESVIFEMGGVDIVLDDGSHNMKDIVATISSIFPKLSLGGIYVIEDLHTSFWRRYDGGYHSKSNFFRFILEIVYDMHSTYHSCRSKHPSISNYCSSIHIHDSIAVFQKSEIFKPTHSRIP